MRFRANTVRILRLDGVTTLAFGDQGEAPSVGVLLSVSENNDEQARNLGIDGLYFEAIGANVSGYHLILNLSCEERLVRLSMKGGLKDLDEAIEIEVVDDTIQTATLQQTIEMMAAHVQ